MAVEEVLEKLIFLEGKKYQCLHVDEKWGFGNICAHVGSYLFFLLLFSLVNAKELLAGLRLN